MSTKTEKLDGRHLPEEALRALRARAIAAARKGVKRGEIARILGMSRNWVWKTLRAAEKHGEEAAIAGHKRGPKDETIGVMRILTPKEEAQLQKWIVDENPAQMKFPWAVWTRKAVQDLILREFKKEVAIRTISTYMKRWGMTPQRPQKKTLQQDDKAVAEWLDKVYPLIAERAKQEGALILWEDETAIKQDSNWVRGYAPKGKTPTLLQDNRSRYGAPVMLSAINNQGKVFFMLQRMAVNSYHFIRFLHRLILDLGSDGRKLFVICDNARIHHSKLVKAWAKKHEAEIEIFHMPAYSPELNPDEFLNRSLKTELRLQCSGTHAENLNRARAFMENCRRDPERSRRCFSPDSVRYAQAEPEVA